MFQRFRSRRGRVAMAIVGAAGLAAAGWSGAGRAEPPPPAVPTGPPIVTPNGTLIPVLDPVTGRVDGYGLALPSRLRLDKDGKARIPMPGGGWIEVSPKEPTPAPPGARPEPNAVAAGQRGR